MFVVLPGKVVSVGQTISKIPPEQLMSTPTVTDLLQSRKSTLKRAFKTLYYGSRRSFFSAVMSYTPGTWLGREWLSTKFKINFKLF